MTFDPMAAAVDWLDAYRAGDIERILEMYAEDATVHCACSQISELVVGGREALRTYWTDRLIALPATDLLGLRPSQDAVELTYQTPKGAIQSVFNFGATGRITSLHCKAGAV